MTTMIEAITGTDRCILHYFPGKGWATTTKEGADWGELAWCSSAAQAIALMVNDAITYDEADVELVAQMEAKGHSTVEWWPEKQKPDGPWFRDVRPVIAK